jgi:acetate kinase
MTAPTPTPTPGPAGTVLVLNTGSSSIKYRLLELPAGRVLVSGLLEGVGEDWSRLTHRVGEQEVTVEHPVADPAAGFELIRRVFEENGGLPAGLRAVGHRVVQGGDRFAVPSLIDDDVLAAIDDLVPLAPLHNPSNAAGIRLARSLYPDVPQVAVFDTSFHSTMPPRAHRYALPAETAARLRIRRYGAHGTSHGYVSRAAAAHLGREPAEVKLVTLHLGNGASVAAVDGGACVDTSMGMTPLEGLVMGTRSGDLDPAVVLYLQREGGLSVEEVDRLLNRESGLRGLAGTNDVRRLSERADEGDPVALEALDVYCYRIRKYVGAYAAVLGRVDGLVFTGGVGENSSRVRAQVCGPPALLGIELDPAANATRSTGSRTISTPGSAVPVLVVPTDEELEIARQALAVIDGG